MLNVPMYKPITRNNFDFKLKVRYWGVMVVVVVVVVGGGGG